MYNIKCEEQPMTPPKTTRPFPDADKRSFTPPKTTRPNPNNGQNQGKGK